MALIMETGPFSVGERALVPFTDKNYEAKVLKAEFRCADVECREGDRPDLCASVLCRHALPLMCNPMLGISHGMVAWHL